MDARTVLRVLEAVAPNAVWLAGGWGIDALLGRQTREHGDLDLLHRAKQEPAVLRALEALGYRETLDLHPLLFAEDGTATQKADTEGATFPTPRTASSPGTSAASKYRASPWRSRSSSTRGTRRARGTCAPGSDP
ncbi:lincosamide nucleotidyltransferase A/C/D/E [Amycolatopsis lexingtonensis]|uniref:Lincosamide nucleotidyltransferase A/C/D/E n=1 Tax=Amycolatopsis lexingtonensis TaxID=218822 RepID=A0ABR9I2D6_9PSEU|nr:hypothetical protein [Amycolatopsis lexingtonensis]MBE1497367.1 lincosamide nucleotidyltransferase A/C/D/E [Amycolatopsis lexingtonensis]